jgi:plastocyanin
LRLASNGKPPTVRYLPVAVALASLLLVAGCGGDNGEETTTTTTASAETFTISETDFALSPSTVNVDAPGTYTFEATNDGGTDHALEIEGNGIEEETDTIAAGESASVTVDLEAGTYEMYCPIDGHRAQGMEGEITVSG